MNFKNLLTAAMIVTLSACGGGGDSGPTTPPIAPGDANAGSDQSVNEAVGRVTLSGSGGGTGATTFSWSQQSGPSVTLNNASAASASFTTPEVDGSASVPLVFELTVTDDDGPTTDTVTINVRNTHVMISGTVRFENVPFNAVNGNGLDYDSRAFEAARGVVVRMVDSSQTTLASTISGADGTFSLRVPSNLSNLVLRVLSQLESESGSPATWDVVVQDNTNNDAVYVVQATASTLVSDTNVGNFDIASGWSDPSNSYTKTRQSGPFAILDAIYQAIQKTVVADSAVTLPTLQINWSVNNRTCSGSISTGCIGTSFYTAGELYILGAEDSDTDEFDHHVVIHEWGHYFEDKLSRSDSIGGSHSGGDRLDPRVAFGEGFGNALSGIITDDPQYRDSFGTSQGTDFVVNVENNDSSGWFDESTVQGVLYDLYDSTADSANDSLALGWQPLYDVFVSNAYKQTAEATTVFSFLQELRTQQSGSASAINSLAVARGINGTDALGSGETNHGSVGATNVLPVYTNIVSGTGQTVCTTNIAGTYNKLGNRRYFIYQPAANSTQHQFVTSNSSASGNSTVVIYQQGTFVGGSGAPGEEDFLVNLTAGQRYLVEVRDETVVGSSTRRDNCITLTITNNAP